MTILIYFWLCILSVITFFAFIFIRVYSNPLKRIPGRRFTRPIFGNFLDYIRCDNRLLDFLKPNFLKYGPIRISYVFFGEVRLNISDSRWMKVYISLSTRLAFSLSFHFDFSTFYPQTAKITNEEIFLVQKKYFWPQEKTV